MIRQAQAQDHPALKALWHTAFGDSYEVIDVFFTSPLFVSSITPFVYELDNIVVSALYLLDAGKSRVADGKMLSTAYFYALATHPEYRGRGFAAHLTKEVLTWSYQAGFALNVISPAEPSLFPYYQGLGFDHTLLIGQGGNAPVTYPTQNIMSTDLVTYSQLRPALLPPSACLYSLDFLQAMAQSATGSGGGLYHLEWPGETAIAIAEIRGGNLYLQEVLPTKLAPAAQAVLAEQFGLPLKEVRCPAGGENDRPIALYALAPGVSLPNADIYFPFILD